MNQREKNKRERGRKSAARAKFRPTKRTKAQVRRRREKRAARECRLDQLAATVGDVAGIEP